MPLYKLKLYQNHICSYYYLLAFNVLVDYSFYYGCTFGF